MNASHRAVKFCSKSLLDSFKEFILNYFGIVRRASEQICTHYELYFARYLLSNRLSNLSSKCETCLEILCILSY